MTYKQALDYINGLECLGIKFGLSNIKKVLKLLGNPEKKLCCVHIAGTNGKGSVAVMLSSILKEAGFKTGLYTSPHLINLSERIQINSKRISEADITVFTETILNATGRLSLDLTYFEFITVMAFMCFSGEKVDMAVIETGMGGRLDATNVIKNPLVSVITNIDYEHTEYLGDKLGSIAREKAGIIKKDGLVVSGAGDKKAQEAIAEICRRKTGRLFLLDRDFKVSVPAAGKRVQEFDYRGIRNNYRGLRIRLMGGHQVRNAALAVAVMELLGLKDVLIGEGQLREGLLKAAWPGRLDFIDFNTEGKKMRVVLDGAHNPSGIDSLRDFLQCGIIAYDELILVLGALADKDVGLMTSKIMPLVKEVIVVSPPVERALDRPALKREALKYADWKNVHTAHSVGAGIRQAFKLSRDSSLICITGSLYVIGEALKELKRYN